MPTRPVRKLHVVTASAPAKPEVRFAIEPFYVIARELPPLFKKHWRELGRDRGDVPLDPDWDSYMQHSIAGRLQVLTARVGDELVGYVFNLVGPHLHYRSTLHSIAEMYWLDPRYRHGWTGLKMLRRNDDEMRRRGVVRTGIAEHLGYKNQNGRMMRVILRRLGYRARDVHYSKVFDT